MTKGDMKRVTAAIGFGVVQPDGSEKGASAEKTALNAPRSNRFAVGQTVTFDIRADDSGRQLAANVVLA